MFDDSLSVKQNMENYLRATYGKEFVVSEPRLVGGNWTRPPNEYISRDAYPADDSEIKFDISWFIRPRTYSDHYLTAKLSTEGKRAMEKKLREVYGEGNFYIQRYESGWSKVNLKVDDHRLTWSDLMNTRSERSNIDFSYFVFFDGKLDRKKEAQRACKILKENLIDYKVGHYNFSVDYIYSNKKKECMDIWRDKERSRHETSETMYKSGILKDWIRVNYWGKGSSDILDQEVKSAEDLLNTRFQIKEGK